MLRKIRIALAALFFIGITMLFLDITGIFHLYLGWMAKVQLLPAILSLNIAVVLLLLVVTLLFGRTYCSVICPMGVMQDCFSWLGGKCIKHRFRFRKAHNILRYGVLGVFVLLMVFGLNSIAVLVAPYSAYGRIATELFQPVYCGANNLMAFFAERANSYAFYSVDVWVKSGVTLAVAIVTFLLIGFLSFRWGRLWCNTICPVGSFLGLISRFAIFRPVIDTDKCIGCRKCEHKCKSQCIDIDHHTVDTSRCVACMDCLSECKVGAIKFRVKSLECRVKSTTGGSPAQGRRKFLATVAAVGAGMALQAQEKTIDGGLATLQRKHQPERKNPLRPFGSAGEKHFTSHCTACQLCVSECPHRILRPSTSLTTLMQPELSFEQGFCPPDCTRCSHVCPTGAINSIDPEAKSAISIGHAVTIPANCLLAQGINCNACSRHCPTGAIQVMPGDTGNPIVTVNESVCIGCGACEYYCPARPAGAIYVEGREVHTNV